MVIQAKYPGKCRECGGSISVGDRIEWSRGAGARHVKCPARQSTPAQNTEEDAPYVLRGGSGYGCRGWQPGNVVRSSERHRADGWPEYVTVVTAQKRYVREDGMSFGVGDEEGYLYSARCRAASEDEAGDRRRQDEARAEAERKKKRLAEIKYSIQKGEHPEGEYNLLDGERLHDTQDIYGGGDWFVITEDEIWYVRNNGRDGDDWSRNNVVTGGAGAVGWRVPLDLDLANEIRSL